MKLKLALLATSSLWAQAVCAAPADDKEGRLDIGGTLWAETRIDRNAFRIPENSDIPKTREQQNYYGLELRGAYHSDMTNFTAHYNGGKEFYTQGSQEDDVIVNGESQLAYGNETSIFDLDLRHSTRRQLNNPEDDDLAVNTNQQRIYFARPSVKTRADKVNSLSLAGIFTAVRFDSEEREDTDQAGAELGWLHRTPYSKDVGLVVSASDIRYKTEDELDYRYTRAFAYLTSETRNLTYLIQGGINRIEPLYVDVVEEDPFYNAEIAYTNSGNIFTATGSYELTATSFLRGLLDNNVSVGGSDNVEDQIKLQNFEIIWENKTICNRCTALFSYAWQELEYLRFDEYDQQADVWTLEFRYRLSPKMEATGLYSERDIQYVEQTERDVLHKRGEARLAYQFSRLGRIELFTREESRDRVDDPYKNLQYGIRLGIEIP